MIRVEGSVKNGEFVATSVAAMGPPPQRNEGAAPAPQLPRSQCPEPALSFLELHAAWCIILNSVLEFA